MGLKEVSIMGCNCSADAIEKLETPGSMHYARFICSECGTFLGWAPKPENEDKRRDGNNRWRKMWGEKGFRCGICGATKEEFPGSGQWQLDHIIQLEAGGQDNFSNTMILCVFCHTIKNIEQKRRVALTKSAQKEEEDDAPW